MGFYIFVTSLFSISSTHIPFMGGALVFASLLGLVAIFAPGGLGAREGVLVYFLSYVVPSPVAMILSVLSRLWMTLVEIALIGVVYLSSKFRKMCGKRVERI